MQQSTHGQIGETIGDDARQIDPDCHSFNQIPNIKSEWRQSSEHWAVSRRHGEVKALGCRWLLVGSKAGHAFSAGPAAPAVSTAARALLVERLRREGEERRERATGGRAEVYDRRRTT